MLLNLMLLNRLIPKIYLISRKNQNGFRTNRSTSAKILTIQHILEGAKSINLPATRLLIEFSKAFNSIYRKYQKKYICIREPQRKVDTNKLYLDTRSMVRSPHTNTVFCHICWDPRRHTGIFIICLDYVLKMS